MPARRRPFHRRLGRDADEARATNPRRHGELDAEASLRMEREAVKYRSPTCAPFRWWPSAKKKARLTLHGCHFSIGEGRLYLLDEAENTSAPSSSVSSS